MQFIDLLTKVFANPKEDILDLLNKKENDVLLLLGIKLHIMLVEKFTELDKYELMNRKKKYLKCEDIFIIGYSLVSDLQDSRLKKILRPIDESTDKSADTDEFCPDFSGS